MEKEISKYSCYTEYLDSLVVEDDQKYLGDIETARQLVQLGYRYKIVLHCLILTFSTNIFIYNICLRSSGKTLSYEEFWQMKEEMAISQGFGMKKIKRKTQKSSSDSNNVEPDEIDKSSNADNENNNVMVKFLRDRYRMMVDNTINTLLFIIVQSDQRGELSGHIDLNQRFQEDPNFQKYLKGIQPILPQPGDLTFFNWKKSRPMLSNSDNWEILSRSDTAMLRSKHSPAVLVSLNMVPNRSKLSHTSKNKSRKETKERKSSTEWTELDADLDSGFRILYWDSFLK